MKVIVTHSFRWSSPLLFNDPFDHQTGFVLKEGAADKMAAALDAAIERMIFGDIVPPEPHSVFTMLSLQLRAIRDKLPRNEVLASLHEGSKQGAQNMIDGLDRFNREIQEHLSHARIFCVSELHDNVVMWSHYAEQHRGVVFKLNCIDSLDNTLLAARKVRYTKEFLSFPDAETYARSLTGEAPLDMLPIMSQIAFTKHIDWSYEREWRVQLPLLNEPAGDGTSILREHPRVFDSIYLGCRMPEEDVQKVSSLVSASLPQAQLFRARTSRSSFTLVFDQIK